MQLIKYGFQLPGRLGRYEKSVIMMTFKNIILRQLLTRLSLTFTLYAYSNTSLFVLSRKFSNFQTFFYPQHLPAGRVAGAPSHMLPPSPKLQRAGWIRSLRRDSGKKLRYMRGGVFSSSFSWRSMTRILLVYSNWVRYVRTR